MPTSQWPVSADTFGTATSTQALGSTDTAGNTHSQATDLVSSSLTRIQLGPTKHNALQLAAALGVTIDPTGSVTSVPGINSCIAWLSTNLNGGDLVFPPGNYIGGTGDQINWLNQASSAPASNVWISGAGKTSTSFTRTSGGGTFFAPQGLQNATTFQTQYLTNVVLRDFSINGVGLFSTPALTLVSITTFDHLTIKNVYFYQTSQLFLSAGLVANTFTDQKHLLVDACDFVGQSTPGGIESIRVSDIDTARFRNCYLSEFEFGGIGIYQNVRNFILEDSRMEYASPDGYSPGNQPTQSQCLYYKSSNDGITIRDNYFDGMRGGGIIDGGLAQWDNFGWSNARAVTITGNTIRNCGTGIDISGGEQFLVAGNTIEYNQGYGIAIGTSGTPLGCTIRDNKIRNNNQGGGSRPDGIYVQPAACNSGGVASCTVVNNWIGDDQVQPTQTNGIEIDIKAARTMGAGWKFNDNDLSRAVTPFAFASGVISPRVEFQRNRGYNPRRTVSVGSLTSQQPSQPQLGAPADIIVGGPGGTAGTVTSISKGVLTAPSDPIVATDLANGSGSGFTSTGTNTIGFTFMDGSNTTQLGPASSSFGPIGATDEILVSSLPAPAAPSLNTAFTPGGGVVITWPAGTYYAQCTWFNEVGEGPPSASSSGLTITSGQDFHCTPYSGTPPTGATGMKVYFVSPSPITGLVGIAALGNSGTLGVVDTQMNEMPVITAPPTVAPSMTVVAGQRQPTPNPHNQLSTSNAQVTYEVAMTYVTYGPDGMNESAMGPTSSITLNSGSNTNQVIQFNQITLDSFILVANGQTTLRYVRYYAVGTSPQLGLLWQAPVGIVSGSQVALAPYRDIALIASPQMPPGLPVGSTATSSPDFSQPPSTTPTNGRGVTAGWRVPTNCTAVNCWLLNSGGNSWSTTLTPASTSIPSNVAGTNYTANPPGAMIIPPFILKGPGAGGNAGTSGTFTATSSTTGTVSGTPWTTNAYAGCVVTAGTSSATVVSNTSHILTVAGWIGGTPSSTASFTISPPTTSTANTTGVQIAQGTSLAPYTLRLGAIGDTFMVTCSGGTTATAYVD